jgi:hypothetical protein
MAQHIGSAGWTLVALECMDAGCLYPCMAWSDITLLWVHDLVEYRLLASNDGGVPFSLDIHSLK